jgi:hypothetical protein
MVIAEAPHCLSAQLVVLGTVASPTHKRNASRLNSTHIEKERESNRVRVRKAKQEEMALAHLDIKTEVDPTKLPPLGVKDGANAFTTM